MERDSEQIFEFDEFLVDLSEKTLLKNGVPIRLTPKALDTLAVLIRNAGRLLEKDELMREIWQDRFVEEGNLAFNVKVLRKALGDNAANPRFIETVQRRGYRFIADVRRVRHANGKGLAQKSKLFEPGLPGDLSEGSILEVGADNADENRSVPSSRAIRADDENRSMGSAPSSRTARSRRLAYLRLVAGTLLAVAIGFGLYQVFSTAVSPSGGRLTAVKRLTANGDVRLAAFSPDGKFIAFTAGESGKQSLWLKNIPSGSETQLSLKTEHTSFNSLAFSPDGAFIFYGSKGMLFRLPVLGDAPTEILSDFGGEISFSPDGKRFAYIAYPPDNRENAALVVSNIDGGERTSLAVSTRPTLFLRSAAWSPDGKHIVCAALNSEGHQEIAVVRVSDGHVSNVPTPKWNTILRIAWAPDGNGLLVVAEANKNLLNQIWSVRFPSGESRKLTDDSHNYQSVSVAADGRSIMAVRAEQSAHLFVMPAGDRDRIKQITGGFEKFDGVFSLGWLDIDKIFYANAPSGRPELWQSNEDGSDAKRISTDVTGGAITPDSQYTVFQDIDDSGPGLFKLNRSDNRRTRLTSGSDDHPAISPDGGSIVFTRYGEDVALWTVPIDGGEPKRLTSFTGYPTASVFSPDGRMIAIYRGVSSNLSPPTIAIIDARDGEILKEFSVHVQFSRNWLSKIAIQWAPDGKAVYFLSINDNISNIFRQPVDGGPVTQITDFADGLIFNFAFSPDGSKLLLSRGSFSRDVILLANAE